MDNHARILDRIRHGFTCVRNGTLAGHLLTLWRRYAAHRRILWWNSQAGKREYITVKLIPGIKMRLYFDSQLSQLIYCEDFEYRERQFLEAFLRPGDVFVDVGANIGLFTLIAARFVGVSGRVYAFEPCTKAYLRLLANIELNKLNNVACYQLALSNTNEPLDMTISLDGFDAWNSFTQPIAGTSFAIERVNCITWDTFAQQHGLVGRVTMMKIDVEGWESHVLLGGRETLSRLDAPILQVEFTDQAAQMAGSSCAELYHLLEEFGYKMFVYDPKARQLVPDPLRDNYPYLNLIAAKQKQLEQITERLQNRHSR